MTKDRASQREMLETPNRWPKWPLLPMKRSVDYSPNLGFVTADFPTVVLKQALTMSGILLQLACEDGEGLPVLGSSENQHMPKDSKAYELYESNIIKRYDDIDAMLDDGWVVD